MIVRAALCCLILFVAGCTTHAAPAANCSADDTSLIAMSPQDFDETLGSGWRVIADRPGCETAAADLINRYRARHPEAETDQTLSLNWHEAQLRAASGEYRRAILLMERARPAGDAERNVYIDATVAFLKRDRPALLAARARYLNVPPPPDWAQATERFHQRTGQTLTWPMNTNIIDGLVACFDRPYHIAYSAVCWNTPAPPH